MRGIKYIKKPCHKFGFFSALAAEHCQQWYGKKNAKLKPLGESLVKESESNKYRQQMECRADNAEAGNLTHEVSVKYAEHKYP